MAKEGKSIRFSDRSLEIVNSYPTSYSGSEEFTGKLEELIAASEVLYSATKHELKDIFTVEEACLMVDVNNSHLYIPQGYPLSSLNLCVHDGERYEGLGEKWGVDICLLLDKINKLSNYQAHCIFLMCNEFWNTNVLVRNERPIKEVVADIFKIKR